MAKISAFNHGQIVKISTMTTAKIQIFHGQNGQPKIENFTTKFYQNNTNFDHAMNEIQIFFGENGKPLI